MVHSSAFQTAVVTSVLYSKLKSPAALLFWSRPMISAWFFGSSRVVLMYCLTSPSVLLSGVSCFEFQSQREGNIPLPRLWITVQQQRCTVAAHAHCPYVVSHSLCFGAFCGFGMIIGSYFRCLTHVCSESGTNLRLR